MEWIKVASITTTGSAGSATGTSGNVNIRTGGELQAVFVGFTTMPATTDVTISEILPNGGSRTLLTLTNVNTDAVHQVRIADSTTAGAAGTGFVYPVVGSTLKVDVAQGDAVTNGVIVYMMIDQSKK